jgi:hypothetical protein
VGAFVFNLRASGIVINADRLYESILEYVRLAQNLEAGDRVQVLLGDVRYPGEVFASTVLTLLSQISVERIVDLITEMLEYDRDGREWNDIQIRVTYIRTPRGNGYLEYTSMAEFVKSKRCVIEVKEQEKCGYVAIMLGKYFYTPKEEYNKFRRSYPARRNEADRLYRELGLGRDELTLDDFDMIETALKISIIVIAGVGLEIIRPPKYKDENNHVVPLLMVDNHYHFVSPSHIGGLWAKEKFCMKCLTAYRHINHPCIETCDYCKSKDCKARKDTQKIMCYECNFEFLGPTCRDRHKCDVRRCKECSFIYRKKKEHRCHERKCRRCNKWFELDVNVQHQCYMQPVNTKKAKQKIKAEDDWEYIVYDYECTQDEEGKHYPSLIVAMYLSSDEVFTFTENDKFCEWLFQKKHKGFTAIAHNGGKYDVHFIKQYMLKNNLESDDIVKGNTIFYSITKRSKMRLIDSYKLIPIGLRKFPKTFCLKNVEKGYFPYRFYSPEHKFYVGPIPDIKYFEFDNMSEEEGKKGREWYREQEGKVYDINAECMKYCVDDVRVLKEGCREFRKWIIEVSDGDLDPLQEMTIAGVCMKLYRMKFMEPETIAVLDQLQSEFFYETQDAWLAYMEYKLKRPLSKDVEDCDGYDEVEKRAYAFLNCLDNGCSSCFHSHKVHDIKQLHMFELRHELTKRIERLREKGIVTYFVWECKFRKSKEYDAFYREYMKTRVGALRVRDAFFGGRTEPIHLYYKCQDDEEIVYEDATSMYPSVQSGFQRGLTKETYHIKKPIYYPVGHPVKITSNFKDLKEYFGIVKCRVTCPQNLFLPVLPERKRGKLLFDLTPKIGTWVIEEVLLAIEQGYVIEEIYEIWHWEEKSASLFDDYVKCFMKLKIAASGWPDDCQTYESKREYLDAIEREEDIELQWDDIEDNPGKRFIAKMMLNNLWGKLGQQLVLGSIKDCFSDSEFFKYVCNDEIEITDVILQSASARTIRYVKRTEFSHSPGTTNVVLAAFTTAHARIRIYEALLLTGTSTLYMDTDSVIYKRKRGEVKIYLGKFLGDFTNELAAGEWITEYVSTGPKSYGYVTNTGKVYLKVKGFTLSSGTKQLINMDVMKTMVLSDKSLKVLTRPLQFLIDKHHGIKTKILGEGEGKEFGLTFDKRFIELEGPLCVRTQPFDACASALLE